jgi:predicted Zn-dependent peptidase
MHRRMVADNGLRVITTHMPHTKAVCIAVFVGAGSRYERQDESGCSHFIEHLCFKGTPRRPTAKEIAETIDGVGGLLNGGTDKEFTIYWCKVARQHFVSALDLLTDMIRCSRFDNQDIERERRVITEELNESMDSPQDRVNRLIDEVIWPGHPLGREIIGSRETVAAISRNTLLDYMHFQYGPGNAVVSVAGDISHDEVVSYVDEAFGDWAITSPRSPEPVDNRQEEPRLRIERRDTEQAHLCLAVCGLPFADPDRFNLDLLNIILGGGMSSRLNLEIRERRGLAYDIHSYAEYFLDSGAVIVYAGVDPQNVTDTIKATVDELTSLKKEIPEVEINKAKEMVKGRLLLSMEDTRSVAGWAGGQDILIDKVRTVEEVLSILDSITAQDLKRVAESILVTERLSLAVVGPVGNESDLFDLLKI